MEIPSLLIVIPIMALVSFVFVGAVSMIYSICVYKKQEEMIKTSVDMEKRYLDLLKKVLKR